MNKKLSVKDRAMLAIHPVAPAPAAVAPTDAAPARPKTGPGAFVAHLAKESEVLRENQALKEDLKIWSDATPARKLDPALVVASKWANRHEDSFKDEAFESLKSDIDSAGGNVQAIKVRPLAGSDPQRYELVFGHRRHRACLELGLPVLALVESITEQALFQEMDRENRQRADLRPYEQGVMYARALDEGLYPSLRKLAEEIGVKAPNVSVAIKLAKLPAAVLDAFPSRRDIQYRWVGPLSDALESNPDAVLAKAAQIASGMKSGSTGSAGEVFKRLTGGDVPIEKSHTKVIKAGRNSVTVTEKGAQISYQFGGLEAAKRDQLEKFIRALLAN